LISSDLNGSFSFGFSFVIRFVFVVVSDLVSVLEWEMGLVFVVVFLSIYFAFVSHSFIE
jgi:hypothetical protein